MLHRHELREHFTELLDAFDFIQDESPSGDQLFEVRIIRGALSGWDASVTWSERS